MVLANPKAHTILHLTHKDKTASSMSSTPKHHHRKPFLHLTWLIDQSSIS